MSSRGSLLVLGFVNALNTENHCQSRCVGVASPVSAEAVTQRHRPEGGAMLRVWPVSGIGRTAIKTDDSL